jgi:hypothetical protein
MGGEMTYECVHGFECCFASLESIVDLVRPRAHLYGLDQFFIDNRLPVNTRKERF